MSEPLTLAPPEVRLSTGIIAERYKAQAAAKGIKPVQGGDWFTADGVDYLNRDLPPNKFPSGLDENEFEIRLNKVENYSSNNGMLAFINPEGTIQVGNATPENVKLLVESGYTPSSIYVPFSNGEVPSDPRLKQKFYEVTGRRPQPTNEVVEKHDNSTNSTVVIHNQGQIDVPSVEARDKVRTQVDVVRGEKIRNAGNYVIKEFFNEGQVNVFLAHYKYLKDSGFPIPTTVRRITGKNQLLITDLTEAGKKQVFSQNEIAEEDVNPGQQIANIEDIHAQLQQIVRRADQLDIRIDADAYFVVLDTNNQGKIILGDLGTGIAVTDDEKKTYFGAADDINEMLAERFYDYLTGKDKPGKLHPSWNLGRR